MKCKRCNQSDRPVFYGQVVFKGSYTPPTCDECGESLVDEL